METTNKDKAFSNSDAELFDMVVNFVDKFEEVRNKFYKDTQTIPLDPQGIDQVTEAAKQLNWMCGAIISLYKDSISHANSLEGIYSTFGFKDVDEMPHGPFMVTAFYRHSENIKFQLKEGLREIYGRNK